jgi:hypothetical protein
MASWKKVLVSGSAGEFSSVTASVGLRVGNNQTISTTQAILTGSFTGSFTGNGAGLTGITADFPTNNVQNITGSNKIFIQTGSDNITNAYITYTDFLTDLAGTNLTPDGDSLNLADTITNLTSVSATSFTATAATGFLGTASWANNVLTASYVTGSVFTNTNPALSASYALTASYALNSVGGTLAISASNGGNASIILASETLTVSGTLNEIEVTADTNNNLLQIGLPNNVTIAGNLTVNGTVTTVSSSNILVADKFIVLSSGSNNNNDGGIIVQNAVTNTTGSGYGLFLEGQGFTGALGTPTPRWGVTSSISQFAQNAASPDEYMVTAKTVASAQSANSAAPTYGGASNVGNGNMVIDSAGDIWIYVY